MAYYGVRIGGYHCWDDWGCRMESKEVLFPDLRTIKVEVPGKDGYLDLTDALRGRPMYDNRKIKIVLIYEGVMTDFGPKVTAIADLIHGKVRSIVFDDEAEYTYAGRCTVNYTVESLNICKITIDVDAQPFKRSKTAMDTATQTIGTTGIVGFFVENSGNISDKYSVVVKLPSALTGTQKARISVRVDGARRYWYDHKFTKSSNEFDCNGDSFSPDENGDINVYITLYKKDGNVPSGFLTSVTVNAQLYKAVI